MFQFNSFGVFALLMTSWAVAQDPAVRIPGDDPISRLSAEHLPNAFRVNNHLISGGLPEGEVAFAELQKLGVQTIISVDGATPDVATAKKFGLRYVHLPHGYDGISPGRALELAKAVRDLPGPIYIHCHHGKHRSPAAAATACRILGQLDATQAHAFLQLAGTSANYRGLYQAVEDAAPQSNSDLDQLQVEFRETSPLPPLVESMVEIEHIFDRLKQGLKDQSPKSSQEESKTSTAAAHDALLLREQFTELLRHEETNRDSDDYRNLLRDAETLAKQLELMLNQRTNPRANSEQIESHFKAMSKNCTDCHRQFRDQPKSVTNN